MSLGLIDPAQSHYLPIQQQGKRFSKGDFFWGEGRVYMYGCESGGTM